MSAQSPNRTIWLLLSYLWIAVCCVVLPAIPLVAEREDDFAKWHAKHGLVLALGFFAVSVVLLGLGSLLGMAWAPLGIIFRILWAITGMVFLVICAVALMKGLEGQRWTLKPIEGILGKLNV